MDKIRIACIGDSITEGYGTADPISDCYPAVLQRKLGEDVEVRNFGISGFCVLDTADCPYLSTMQYQASLRFKPDIVIIMLGSNDSKIANFAGHDNDFRRTYGELLTVYMDLPQRPDVYAVTSPTAWRKEGELYWDYMVSPEIIHERIVDMQKLTAGLLDVPVIDMHQMTQKMKKYFEDGVHPNTEGSKKIAEMIVERISESVQKHAERKAKEKINGFL